MLRRHDYDVEIAGNNAAVHYISDYIQVAVLGLGYSNLSKVIGSEWFRR